MSRNWNKIVLLEQRHWVSLVLPSVEEPVQQQQFSVSDSVFWVLMDFGAYQWSCGTVGSARGGLWF